MTVEESTAADDTPVRQNEHQLDPGSSADKATEDAIASPESASPDQKAEAPQKTHVAGSISNAMPKQTEVTPAAPTKEDLAKQAKKLKKKEEREKLLSQYEKEKKESAELRRQLEEERQKLKESQAALLKEENVSKDHMKTIDHYKRLTSQLSLDVSNYELSEQEFDKRMT